MVVYEGEGQIKCVHSDPPSSVPQKAARGGYSIKRELYLGKLFIRLQIMALTLDQLL